MVGTNVFIAASPQQSGVTNTPTEDVERGAASVTWQPAKNMQSAGMTQPHMFGRFSPSGLSPVTQGQQGWMLFHFFTREHHKDMLMKQDNGAVSALSLPPHLRLHCNMRLARAPYSLLNFPLGCSSWRARSYNFVSYDNSIQLSCVCYSITFLSIYVTPRRSTSAASFILVYLHDSKYLYCNSISNSHSKSTYIR